MYIVGELMKMGSVEQAVHRFILWSIGHQKWLNLMIIKDHLSSKSVVDLIIQVSLMVK